MSHEAIKNKFELTAEAVDRVDVDGIIDTRGSHLKAAETRQNAVGTLPRTSNGKRSSHDVTRTSNTRASGAEKQNDDAAVVEANKRISSRQSSKRESGVKAENENIVAAESAENDDGVEPIRSRRKKHSSRKRREKQTPKRKTLKKWWRSERSRQASEAKSRERTQSDISGRAHKQRENETEEERRERRSRRRARRQAREQAKSDPTDSFPEEQSNEQANDEKQIFENKVSIVDVAETRISHFDKRSDNIDKSNQDQRVSKEKRASGGQASARKSYDLLEKKDGSGEKEKQHSLKRGDDKTGEEKQIFENKVSIVDTAETRISHLDKLRDNNIDESGHAQRVGKEKRASVGQANARKSYDLIDKKDAGGEIEKKRSHKRQAREQEKSDRTDKLPKERSNEPANDEKQIFENKFSIVDVAESRISHLDKLDEIDNIDESNQDQRVSKEKRASGGQASARKSYDVIENKDAGSERQKKRSRKRRDDEQAKDAEVIFENKVSIVDVAETRISHLDKPSDNNIDESNQERRVSKEKRASDGHANARKPYDLIENKDAGGERNKKRSHKRRDGETVEERRQRARKKRRDKRNKTDGSRKTRSQAKINVSQVRKLKTAEISAFDAKEVKTADNPMDIDHRVTATDRISSHAQVQQISGKLVSLDDNIIQETEVDGTIREITDFDTSPRIANDDTENDEQNQILTEKSAVGDTETIAVKKKREKRIPPEGETEEDRRRRRHRRQEKKLRKAEASAGGSAGIKPDEEKSNRHRTDRISSHAQVQQISGKLDSLDDNIIQETQVDGTMREITDFDTADTSPRFANVDTENGEQTPTFIEISATGDFETLLIKRKEKKRIPPDGETEEDRRRRRRRRREKKRREAEEALTGGLAAIKPDNEKSKRHRTPKSSSHRHKHKHKHPNPELAGLIEGQLADEKSGVDVTKSRHRRRRKRSASKKVEGTQDDVKGKRHRKKRRTRRERNKIKRLKQKRDERAAWRADYYRENRVEVIRPDKVQQRIIIKHKPKTLPSPRLPEYFPENAVRTSIYDRVVEDVDASLPPPPEGKIAAALRRLQRSTQASAVNIANAAGDAPAERTSAEKRLAELERQGDKALQREERRKQRLTGGKKDGKGVPSTIEGALHFALEKLNQQKSEQNKKADLDQLPSGVDFSHNEVLDNLTRLPTKQYIAARVVRDRMKSVSAQCYIYQEEKERELLRNRIELLRREKFQLAQTLFRSAEKLKLLRHEVAYHDLRELSKAPSRLQDDSIAARIEKTISSSGSVARSTWSKIFNKISGTIRRKRQNIEREHNTDIEQRNLHEQLLAERNNLAENPMFGI